MIINKKRVQKLMAEGKRLDGRGLTDYRGPIEIEVGGVKTAEGFAKVRIGETVVMAGVKLVLEKPYPDTPEDGGIMVNCELTPLSSPEYESGPPGMKAVEIARVIDRGIRESHAIDTKKLCIEKGEKAWFVMVDIISINDAGNMFDAAGLAVLAALNDTRLRDFDPVTGVVDYKSKTDNKLPMTKQAIPITVYKLGDKLFVDPSSEEEHCYDAKLIVGSDDKGIISALQKGGDTPISVEDVEAMVDIALEKSAMLRKVFKKALKLK